MIFTHLACVMLFFWAISAFFGLFKISVVAVHIRLLVHIYDFRIFIWKNSLPISSHKAKYINFQAKMIISDQNGSKIKYPVPKPSAQMIAVRDVLNRETTKVRFITRRACVLNSVIIDRTRDRGGGGAKYF